MCVYAYVCVYVCVCMCMRVNVSAYIYGLRNDFEGVILCKAKSKQNFLSSINK